MKWAIGFLLASSLVTAGGIFMLVSRINGGLVDSTIRSRDTGAFTGSNAATPEGRGNLDASDRSALATITAVVREATALAATAGAARTPIPSTPGTGAGGVVAVGQPVEVAGARFTVHQVVDPEPPGTFATAPGNRRVAIEISQEALSGRITRSFAFFKVRDAAGQSYAATITNISPAFQTGQLAPGEAHRGWVSFQVAQGAELTTLTVSVPGVAPDIPIVALQ